MITVLLTINTVTVVVLSLIVARIVYLLMHGYSVSLYRSD